MNRLPNPGLLLLCVAWLLPGLIGHDPWKGDDGAGFARLYTLLQTGDWLAPALDGARFPPLYYWLAAATARLTSPLLALHDGARLASGVFIALALFFTARTARELLGPEHVWAAVLTLLGSLGLLLNGHELNPYTAQLAGVAIALYGLARLAKDYRGGWAVAAGLVVMLLATGMMEPLVLVALALILPLASPPYRTPVARRGLALGLGMAVLAGALWITLLWARHIPLDTALQLNRWPGLSGAGKMRPLFFPSILAWFAWPAWPLAGWALYRARHHWREPGTLLPLLTLALLLALFSVSVNPDDSKGLALLVPLALLGAAGLLILRRGAASALLWFGVMLFGFLALVTWVYWSAYDLGLPAQLARRLTRLGVAGVGELRPWALLLGVLASIAWMVFLGRMQRSALRPMLAWSAGLTFAWVLLHVLVLKPLDQRRSYASVGQGLQAKIPVHDCVDVRGIGAQQRVLLAYHSGRTLRGDETQECRWLLVQGNRRAAVQVPADRWVKRWEGARPGDRDDRFILYGKK